MTPYEIIYSSFRDKIIDYDLLSLEDEDEQTVLKGYLNNAIARFVRLCTKISERDNILNQFNTDLTEEEIDILSELMLCAWIKPKVYNSEKLKNSLSTKDFSVYSPANLLEKLKDLKKETEKNVKAMINEYSVLNPTSVRTSLRGN